MTYGVFLLVEIGGKKWLCRTIIVTNWSQKHRLYFKAIYDDLCKGS